MMLVWVFSVFSISIWGEEGKGGKGREESKSGFSSRGRWLERCDSVPFGTRIGCTVSGHPNHAKSIHFVVFL